MNYRATTATQAYEAFTSESAHAELMREAIQGEWEQPEDVDRSTSNPPPLLPRSAHGRIPVPNSVLREVMQAVETYESAVKLLLGYYATAVSREQSQPPQQLQAANGTGWANYR